MTRLTKMQNCQIAIIHFCVLWQCGCDQTTGNHEAGSAASRIRYQSEPNIPQKDFGESFTNWDDFDGMDATHQALATMTTEEKKRLKYIGLRYKFTDNSMKAIQGLENIEELSVGNNRYMTEKGMLLIGTLPRLKNLVFFEYHDEKNSEEKKPF